MSEHPWLDLFKLEPGLRQTAVAEILESHWSQDVLVNLLVHSYCLPWLNVVNGLARHEADNGVCSERHHWVSSFALPPSQAVARHV